MKRFHLYLFTQHLPVSYFLFPHLHWKAQTRRLALDCQQSLVGFQTRVWTIHQRVQLSETEEELGGNLTVIHWGLWFSALMNLSQWHLNHIYTAAEAAYKNVCEQTANAELSNVFINIHVLIALCSWNKWNTQLYYSSLTSCCFPTECSLVICVSSCATLSPVFAVTCKAFVSVVLAHFSFLFDV